MRKHGHYFKDVSKLDVIDVYRVISLWELDDPCLQHALKKILCGGKRGAKDKKKDIQEAIDTLHRWQEMRKEDDMYAVEDGSGGVISVKCDGPDWSNVSPKMMYAAKPLNGGASWCFTADPDLFNRMGGFGVRHYRFSDSFDEQRMDAIGQNGGTGEHYVNDYPGTLVIKD